MTQKLMQDDKQFKAQTILEVDEHVSKNNIIIGNVVNWDKRGRISSLTLSATGDTNENFDAASCSGDCWTDCRQDCPDCRKDDACGWD